MSNRRADRLFQIVQLLRGGRVRTARELSQLLVVSERTVYRDIDSLVLDGMPIKGVAGTGFRMAETVFLPPLALTKHELEALKMGMQLVKQSGDPGLKMAAEEVLVKVSAVTPHARLDERGRWMNLPLGDHSNGSFQEQLRHAVVAHRKVSLEYRDESGRESERIICPLQLEYWGRVWTCCAWCENRNDFRVFRLDRILGLIVREETFDEEPGRTYQDYLDQLVFESQTTPRE